MGAPKPDNVLDGFCDRVRREAASYLTRAEQVEMYGAIAGLRAENDLLRRRVAELSQRLGPLRETPNNG